MDAPFAFMSPPTRRSTPIQHSPDMCTVCAARQRRHQARNNSLTSEASSAEDLSNLDENVESQIATRESQQDAPPPYSKRRRDQKLGEAPPTYIKVITTPPPGVQSVTVPVTVRYTEIIVLEDDGYSKVILATARKFKTHVKVYDTMDWDRFWECLKQLKPSITMRVDALKDVRGLKQKCKWERFLFTRFPGTRLNEECWEVMRGEICSGEIDKVTITVAEV